MARNRGPGALAYRPGQYNLTDEQRERFQTLKQDKGKRRARKYLQRQDKKGNLTPAGEEIPSDMETMPEPSPGEEAYQQSQTAINQGVSDQFGMLNTREQFTPQSLPQIPTDYMASRQKAADAAYRSSTRRLDDRFARDEESLMQQLHDQGITRGSEAYKNAVSDFRNNRNDAYQAAEDRAYLTGQGEQAQQFSQASGARGQLYGEQLQNYRMPYEQLAAYSPYYQTGAADNRLGQQLGYQTAAREDTQQFTSEQARQDFQRQKELARLQTQLNIKQANSIPRGGGGGGGAGPLSFEEWAKRQDYAAQIQQNQTFDNAVIGGFQSYPGYMPGFGAGVSQGVGAGVGAIVGGALT